jgi:hypothetical protein
MSSDRHPAPSPTTKKTNGQWTFYVFPEGEQREAGQFETEAAARDARFKTLLLWGSNGEKYPSTDHRARLSFD